MAVLVVSNCRVSLDVRHATREAVVVQEHRGLERRLVEYRRRVVSGELLERTSRAGQGRAGQGGAKKKREKERDQP